jgi:phosphatidylglycerol lysyltransferase
MSQPGHPETPPSSSRRHPSTLLGIFILTWTIRFAALLNFVAAVLPHRPYLLSWMAAWLPFEISEGRRIRMLIMTLVLLLLSSGLERGKKSAWVLTIVALACAPFVHLGRISIWPQVLLNLPVIVVLYFYRHYFVARSDPRFLRSALVICPVILLGLLAFGTVRLHQLRFETDGPDSWGGCLQAACELILVHVADTQHPQTELASTWFSILRIAGTLLALLALYLTLRPNLRVRAGAQERQRRALRLIGRYANDPMTSYATLGDKSFFIASTERAAISYVVSGRFAITLADPVGPPDALEQAVVEFSDFCRYQDWVPVFYEVTAPLLPLYRRHGFGAFQIGEDARLDVGRFDLKGRDFQNLRTLCNKARKEGITFRWYDESSPCDEALEWQLGRISERWLAGKKTAEMSFDMGTFSTGELQRHGTGIAINARGQPVAFATWRTFAQGRGKVLDLMRSPPEVRNILDFVLVESILRFISGGIAEINLGNAPLANAREGSAGTSVENRVVRYIYENLNQFYAYKPLFEFKRKYRPRWEPRFLAYPLGESLPLISLALVRAHTSKHPWSFIWRGNYFGTVRSTIRKFRRFRGSSQVTLPT